MLTHLYNISIQLADDLASFMGISPLQDMLQVEQSIMTLSSNIKAGKIKVGNLIYESVTHGSALNSDLLLQSLGQTNIQNIVMILI